MRINRQIVGSADFSFQHFLKGGFIGYNCPGCSSENKFSIKIYQSGIPIENLEPELIDDLVSNNIVNLNSESSKRHTHLSKYVLWRMDAKYEELKCDNCSVKMIAVFGMAEIQPSREYVQFKGIWSLESS